MTTEPIVIPQTNVYLRAFLEPLVPWLERADVSEIICNKPGEIWIERAGASAMERHEIPLLTDKLIERLAGQIARINHQAINKEQPLLAATLPSGERVQIVGPPVTRAHWAIAIRKQVIADICIEDFSPAEGFSVVRTDGARHPCTVDMQLRGLLDEGDIPEFLRLAVGSKKTMLISGGTSAGKTSLLNALVAEIPETDRLITVEDTAEVKLSQPNSVSLIAVRGELGHARVTAEDLLQAALRMRPDRIILGEIRGKEAATFLRAINTGHPGSITTLHADSPAGALEQVALMVLHSGLGLSRSDTIAYVRSIVDIVIQVDRRDGKRQITEIVLDTD